MKRSEWAVLVAVFAVGLAIAGIIVGTSRHHSTHVSAGYTLPPPTTAAPPPPSGDFDVARPPPAPPPPPTPPKPKDNQLVIPSIGTDAPIIPEGATGPNGGALSIPSDVKQVGWWDGVWNSPNGVVNEVVPRPGQPGVAIIAGHIDSASQGPGALYKLSQIKNGASITVYGPDGTPTHWNVSNVQTVLKAALPPNLFVNTGPAQLAVVSCGGPFNSATGHYEDNIIAWATPA